MGIPEKKMKVAKAKKSTHKRGKTVKAIRGKVISAPVTTTSRYDPTQEWEIAEFGPIYLVWGKKKIRSDKGKTLKKYYVKSDEKHHIWIKWKQPFEDDNRIVWSAEPQEMLTNVRDEVQRIIRNKRIWPFPSVADGPDSGFEERVNICKREKYQIWQSKKVEEQGKAWKLLNGIDPTTGSSDASTSETSESEAPEEEEEDDEV